MEQKIIGIIEKIFSRSDASKSITADLDLIDGLGMDSVVLLELITSIEDEFGFTYEDEDLELDNFRRINVIVKNLSKYTKN